MKIIYNRATQLLAVIFIYSGLFVDAVADDQAGISMSDNVVNITLKEWRIKSDQKHVKAGPVMFKVNNIGKEKHELVIVKTDLAVDKLPMRDGKVIEDEAGEVIGEVEEFPPNTIQEATFELTPGRYVLFCNIAEMEHGEIESHYSEGMRIVIKVE